MLRSGARGWAPLRAPLGGAPERCPGPEGTPCRCSGAVPGAGHRSGVPRSGALGRRAPPAAPERCPGPEGTPRRCSGAVPGAGHRAGVLRSSALGRRAPPQRAASWHSDRRSVGRTNYLLKMLQFKRICLLSHFRAPCTKPLGRGAIVHPPDNLPRCGSSALCRLNL